MAASPTDNEASTLDHRGPAPHILVKSSMGEGFYVSIQSLTEAS